MVAEMKDLITRLEAAEEGSRELDAEIVKSVCLDAVVSRYPTEADGLYVFHAEALLGTNKAGLPHYTTSLDAALTLVPEGRLWCVGTIVKVPGFYAILDNNGQSTRGATPALALCIACLRARGCNDKD